MIGLKIKGTNGRAVLYLAALMALLGAILLMFGCGDKTKEIIRYRDRPLPVTLIYPVSDSFITVNNPTFVWGKTSDAVRYQLQVAPTSDFVTRTIDTQASDTSHTAVNPLPNSTYYWRVRGQNLDGVWGDWSDAEIDIFYKSDYINYFDIVSETPTLGVPQDVFVVNDSLAYVADGQADLSIFDVYGAGGHATPFLFRNIDPGDDDFAKGVYLAPSTFAPDSFPYAYVADMDGRIQALNTVDTTFLFNQAFGTDQNLEDVSGLIRLDTLWIVAVSSGFNRRKLSFYEILYNPFVDPYGSQTFFQIDLPADGMGLCIDSDYIYVACGTSGLKIFDIRDIFNPILVSTVALSGTSLSVDARGNYAYVAADRSGIFVVDVTDKANPVVINQINTAGRSKDIQIVENYIYIADASGGLKAIDATIPAAAHFVAAYATPYAYGIFATRDWIYICDRDLGLLIFDNRVFGL